MTRAEIIAKAKSITLAVWHIPGVESAILRLVAKVLVRVGLGAGGAALVVSVAEALGNAV